MQYDFPVIVLTTVICTVALFTSIYLLDRISITTRKVWLSVAGIATGFGIWATHFIAMLTYSPRIQNSYNTTLVLVSLSAAILLAILSFAVTSGLPQRLGREKGGLLVGCGIAIMHYSGMAAFEVPGRILWNPSMMVISIVLGSLFSTFALPTELRKKTHRTITSGALLLTLVICNHHFAAMATADLIQNQSITVSTNAPPRLLASDHGNHCLPSDLFADPDSFYTECLESSSGHSRNGTFKQLGQCSVRRPTRI
ncbi:MHYT domain-containing protein [Comamonas sp. wu1-DMT]|uniref:MHYT domain-containing protein n=1 Tax=Comamonas sp. wu1-DMT TaxID=3126390 RepID=UPI0032E4D010